MVSIDLEKFIIKFFGSRHKAPKKQRKKAPQPQKPSGGGRYCLDKFGCKISLFYKLYSLQTDFLSQICKSLVETEELYLSKLSFKQYQDYLISIFLWFMVGFR